MIVGAWLAPLMTMALAAAPGVDPTARDEPGPAELIRLLGSADRVEREEAARTLEELEAAALPALREAEKAGAGDSRSKVSSLIRSIRGRLLDRPSMVAIDLVERPLEEAVRGVAAGSGHTIRLEAGDNPALLRRPVSVRTPAPVPFWEALDRVGRAGRVRLDPMVDPRDPDSRPALRATEGEPPAAPLCRGAFRVDLVGLERRRERGFGAPPDGEPAMRDVLYCDVDAFAEPGRFLDYDGRPRIEAEDDRGRPLPHPPAIAEGPELITYAGNDPDAIARLRWRLAFSPPDRPATRLRRIKGTLPVLVTARMPDPLVIALDDPPGRSYHHGGMTVRFKVLTSSPEHLQLALTLAADSDPSRSRDDRAWRAHCRRLVFEDRDGRRFTWFSHGDIAQPGKETRIVLSISLGRPVRLLLHDLAWKATEIPFEFADVPPPQGEDGNRGAVRRIASGR